MLWALGTARRVDATAAFDAAVTNAFPSHRLAEYSTRQLATVVEAFAAAGFAAPRLCDSIARDAMALERNANGVRPLGEASARTLTSLAWGFAKLRVRSELLFGAIDAAATGRLASFPPLELTRLLWGFARNGVLAPSLFSEATTALRTSLDAYSVAQLATVAWAFSRGGVAATVVPKALVDTLLARDFAH
eukprot:920413-Prymnesium_polylepis.1